MKTNLLMVIVCLVFFSAAVFAGGNQESAGANAEEKITLKWQIWVTPNLTRAFYEDIAAAFEAENPKVDVELVEATATGSAGSMDFIRNRLAAGDVPDLWSNFTDIPSFADAGHLWEFPAGDPDLAKVKNLMSTAYNGKLYSIGTALQPQSIMYYNKKLWAEAGLTKNDIPRTWNELESVCGKIKNAGMVPIITGGEWVPITFFDYFVGPQITKEHPNLWAEIYSGEMKWNNPEIVEILSFMDKLVKKGYIIEGALSIGYAQLEKAFLTEEAVMYPMGSWFTAAEAAADKDWETGCFAVPTKDGEINMTRSGGYGNGFVIYSGSEHPELAFKLLKKVVLDPVFGAKFIEADGLFSNLEPPLTYPMSYLQKELAAEIAELDYSYPIIQHVLGAPAPPGIGDYLKSAGEAILSQSYSSLENILQQIDNFIAETQM